MMMITTATMLESFKRHPKFFWLRLLAQKSEAAAWNITTRALKQSWNSVMGLLCPIKQLRIETEHILSPPFRHQKDRPWLYYESASHLGKRLHSTKLDWKNHQALGAYRQHKGLVHTKLPPLRNNNPMALCALLWLTTSHQDEYT